jgi:DNA-3-methyladenine glycosylase II
VFCEATRHLSKADPRLAAVIREVGPHGLVARRGRYASLCRSIVGQQLSTKAAATIYTRFKTACGGWVTPARVSALSDAELRGTGFSRSKVASVRDLTQAVEEGRLHLGRLARLDDEAIASQLLPIRGIGPWSVDMFLMFVLARPNVLPVGDLGIQNGLARLYGLRERPTPVRMVALTRSWQPYRSVGSWYLWRGLDADLF